MTLIFAVGRLKLVAGSIRSLRVVVPNCSTCYVTARSKRAYGNGNDPGRC